jgi:hypothetical protein
MVELASRLEREVRVTPACCSIAVGDEVLALDSNAGLRIDPARVIARERADQGRAQAASLSGIPIVTI